MARVRPLEDNRGQDEHLIYQLFLHNFQQIFELVNFSIFSSESDYLRSRPITLIRLVKRTQNWFLAKNEAIWRKSTICIFF